MHLSLTIQEVSICICLYQVKKKKNLSSIVGELKQLVYGFLFKKIRPLEWLSARKLLKGAGLTELVSKQLSNVSAGIWPWRSSISVIHNSNISTIEALLSGVKALHNPNTSQKEDLRLLADPWSVQWLYLIFKPEKPELEIIHGMVPICMSRFHRTLTFKLQREGECGGGGLLFPCPEVGWESVFWSGMIGRT